mmetsp:Transcript_73165/g.210092  ORF Transcript_73165/g.210092 Transcript_73165/m.210092 type:complete len:656 (+) Transcript_73165:106-2073(+)|eukprot:CAMPEP_0177203446 /NCGR_PEP_ID=MMETSP0367-20130122/27820_1 /TAXON_ID=447022 ORGANISM="Scrippsiella hangoei-like, Strain SHHI-4" /NCGR_SAMPLE_ID=MMETSP0367 /ASSEMBLY_ACC=CAM_ASM_000362 /LENGTH=655 /DNA_ID=CAMNT_0018652079 /DNA_START=100 /DNA_END=2067 /DNA_ORIENTATION=+
MNLAMKLLVSAGLVATSRAACQSELMKGVIDIGGQQVLLAGEGGVVKDGRLIVRHNAGMTGFSECTEDWAPASMLQLKLLGRSISFNVDLSRVGCACNLAFYLVSSPARDVNGQPSIGDDRQGQPPYYCDANMVGGQWCPEVDIMEANNHAFQATPHSCDSSVNGHYFFCDRSGCSQNTRDVENAYGPGPSFTIDTSKPFNVQTEFLEDTAGLLIGMRTTLRQSTRQVVLEHSDCHSQYLAKLSDAMRDGMSLRITYWGGDARTMAWMDSPPCGEGTCQGENAGYAVISNITVSKHSQVQQDAQLAQGGQSWGSDASAQPAAQKTVPAWQSWNEPTTTIASWSQPVPAPAPWSQPAAEVQVTTTAAWQQPATTTLPQAESAERVMQWVPDIYQPWECHSYANPQQEKTLWCVTAGVQDGYEFQYNGGVGGACGPCWCCKGRAKFELGVATTSPVPMSDADDELVWVASDPRDTRFGQIVPRDVLDDGSRFVTLKDDGVVEWGDSSHVVKRMQRAQVESFLKDSQHGAFSMIMQKYQGKSVLSQVAVRGWWLPTSVGLVLLSLAAVAVALGRARKAVGGRGSAAGAAAATVPPPATPPAASDGCGAMSEAMQQGGAPSAPDGSPFRRVHSSSSGTMLLSRSGASCQGLLAMQEAMA